MSGVNYLRENRAGGNWPVGNFHLEQISSGAIAQAPLWTCNLIVFRKITTKCRYENSRKILLEMSKENDKKFYQIKSRHRHFPITSHSLCVYNLFNIHKWKGFTKQDRDEVINERKTCFHHIECNLEWNLFFWNMFSNVSHEQKSGFLSKKIQPKLPVRTWLLLRLTPMKVYRSSRPEVFYKIRVLKFFSKFTGKQLCQSLFLNKNAGLNLQLY